MRHGKGLGTIGTDANGAYGAPDDLAEAFEVSLTVGRELLPRRTLGDIRHPAGKSFINWSASFPGTDKSRRELQRAAIEFVTRADFDFLASIQAIQISHGHLIKTVEHG